MVGIWCMKRHSLFCYLILLINRPNNPKDIHPNVPPPPELSEPVGVGAGVGVGVGVGGVTVAVGVNVTALTKP